MKDLRRIAIFLASPGDVSVERGHVRSVIEELNRNVARANGLRIDVVGWDTDAVPAFGGDGQRVINGQIADMSEYDLFVGIMWNRFGSPTPRAGSGTEEEFGLALESFERNGAPQIMLYFGQMPASLETPEQLDQKAKVVEFRSKVKQIGLTWRYPSPDAFRELFREHLTKTILAVPSQTPPAASHGEPAKQGHNPARVTSPVQKRGTSNWVLLGDRFFQAESVRERQGQVTVTIEPANADDDEALRQSVGRSASVRFAYQNVAGVAEVTEGERTSGPGGDRWQVVLRITDPNRSGMVADFSYNGMSALELAEMRARLILLNESPTNSRDPFLMGMISGIGRSVEVEEGLIPGLWLSLGGDAEIFPPLARLLAVFYLKTSGTVDQIVRLEIGPVNNGRIKVSFEGLRQKSSSNLKPERIEFGGICQLG